MPDEIRVFPPVERFYYDDADCPAPNKPLHPGVSAVIFDSADRVLFMKRSRSDHWCLPGGRMEMHELAQECCIRETLEETGFETEIVRLVSINTNPRSVVHYPGWQRTPQLRDLFRGKSNRGRVEAKRRVGRVSVGWRERTGHHQPDPRQPHERAGRLEVSGSRFHPVARFAPNC